MENETKKKVVVGLLVFLAVVASVFLCLLIYAIVVTHKRNSPGKEPYQTSRLKGLVVDPAFDLTTYLGLWYEIRRVDSWFEKASDVRCTALYEAHESGNPTLIKVTNTANYGLENERKSIGSAKVTDQNGVLRVSFFPGTAGDYVVVGYSVLYGLSVVTSPSRDYLWLLSRKSDELTADQQSWYDHIVTINGLTHVNTATHNSWR